MSDSFIHHTFKIVTAKRKSKCKGSHYDPTGEQPWAEGVILAGEQCLQVSTGSMRQERNSRFCMDCAASRVQHHKQPFDDIMFELEKHKGIREVEQQSAIDEYFDLCVSEAP